MEVEKNVCSCGWVSFEPDAKAFSRFVCHCELCQDYTSDASNDECFFVASKVTINNSDKINFKRNYKNMSPLARGKCTDCGLPVVSLASSPLISFYLVPTELVNNEGIKVPEVDAHVFYHRRLKDCDEIAPKYSGGLWSHIMTQWILLRSYIVRGGN